jgi:phenylpropionate dioxygenase-like ring-hydroxylating dioxygenase large terminal subunit
VTEALAGATATDNASSGTRATRLAVLDEAWRTAAAQFWHPVARTQDVAPGAVISVTLLGREFALWRTPDGVAALFAGACVHRGTRLADGSVTDGGCLRCPYHGWEFAADGRCESIPQLPGGSIPATAAQPGYAVGEHAGFVWACLAASPESARPTVPELEDPEWQFHVGPVSIWRSQAGRHIENFCDIAHFSILHTSSFGNPDVTEVETYTVDRTPNTLAFRYGYPGRDYLAAPASDAPRPFTIIDLDYQVHLPFAITLRGINGPDSLIFTAVSPIDVDVCGVYWISARRGGEPLDGAAIDRAELEILEEDRVIVEGQRPRRLPLARTAELHLGFDRLAVAYRSALLNLGFPDVPVDLGG